MAPLLDVHHVSELLGGIPISTLYAWRHRRLGPPAIRVGRHLRYRPEDVEQWIDSLNDRGGDRP